MQGRYVAQEINVGGGADASFYAATPPLEAKRLLMSRWATERKRNGKNLKIHMLDVRKAYVNGVPTRSLYVKLPFEMGMGKSVWAKLRRCIYGTRDAGAIWEATYTDLRLKMGVAQGASSPCCFYHAEWCLSLVVHGDDFTCLGTDDALDRYEHSMM